jgi:hypothetical protein
MWTICVTRTRARFPSAATSSPTADSTLGDRQYAPRRFGLDGLQGLRDQCRDLGVGFEVRPHADALTDRYRRGGAFARHFRAADQSPLEIELRDGRSTRAEGRRRRRATMAVDHQVDALHLAREPLGQLLAERGEHDHDVGARIARGFDRGARGLQRRRDDEAGRDLR